MKSRGANTERGAALMLAMWALLLLSAMIMSWAFDINGRLTLTGNANRALEAEAMASSGSEVAMHPMVKPGSSLLTQHRPNRQSFEVRIVGEGGRLNINWLLAEENPQKLEVLRKYLENHGIELNDRDHMIDCLLDWVDADNLVRLNGAESERDYEPSNAPLETLDELKRVRGWQKFTATKNWDADFTLNSTGPIDLAWASREVLLALPGMTEQLVDQFLALRRGPDGIDGTEDDPQFQSLEDVRVALGFTPEQFTALAGLVGFKDEVLRVTSVGKSADVTRVVEMVIRKGEDGTQLISWKEL